MLHFLDRDDVGRNSSCEDDCGDAPVTFGDILDKPEFSENKYWYMYAQEIAARFSDKFFAQGYDCIICADYQDDDYDYLHKDLQFHIQQNCPIEVFRNIYREQIEGSFHLLDPVQLSIATGVDEARLVAFKDGDGSLNQPEYDKISRVLRSAGLFPMT
jgi:hypothetical protein